MNEQTELQKAIEFYENALGNALHDGRNPNLSVLVSTAKSIPELEFLLENANEAICLKSPEFEGSSAFVRLFKENEQQLSQLREAYTALLSDKCATKTLEWEQEVSKLRAELEQCKETSKSVSTYARHNDDCRSQRTSPTTYSDPLASTCDCGLRENMIDFHKAIASVQPLKE
jgi:hypothetical protein